MFNCSNCGHEIDDTRVALPPFCPRCGQPTGSATSPFDDEDDASPLPPPPPMGAPLPPPPPMGAPLPPPPPSSGRGEPSKTLFGMPGLTFEDDGGVAFPSDDDDDELAFPSDDDDEPFAAPIAKPATPVAKPATKPVAPPVRSGPPANKPPPIRAAKPAAPPAIRPPGAGAAKPVSPPPLRPPPPAPAKTGAKPPPLPGSVGARRDPAPAPPPPSHDPFSSGVLPGDSGVAGRSGVLPGESGVAGRSGAFDEDPFFTGDPERMPELGSITYGDATQFEGEDAADRSGVREFEFKDDGDSLELGDLDLPTTSERDHGNSPSQATGQAQGHRRADISAPDFAGLNLSDEMAVDMPGGASSEFGLDDGFGDDGFDLPAPVDRSRGMVDDPNLPAPAGFDRDLDLPVGDADDLDLPTPVMDGAHTGLDLPTPVMGDDIDFGDGVGLGVGMDDLPMPADNLPGLGDDFPAPSDDFSGPGMTDDFSGFDSLPTSADSLPTSADSLPTSADILPTPASNLPRAADNLPTSLDSLELDLDDDGARPSRESAITRGPLPGGAAGGGAREGGVREGGVSEGLREQPGASPSGSPGRAIVSGGETKRDVARVLIYGGLVLAVLGVGGAYMAMEMGLFDPEPPPPPAQGSDEGKDDGDEQPEPPSGEPSERSEALLAKFDLDTPAAYVQVLSLAEGDPVAQAEAALLLHYRYGPDAERLALAGKLLAPYQQGAEQPFVRRVVGLGHLATGKHDEALALLDADEPRSQLYRAWVLLEQGQPGPAREAAEAVTAARANDQAAQLAVLQARFAANPVDGIAAMRQAAANSPNHLALHEALMLAALAQGRLGEAGEIGQKLQLGTVSPAHKAELLRRQGTIAAAQGRTGEAMRLFEQALATQEDLLAARLDRVELWLQNKDFPTLRSEIDLLTREHPKHPAVLKVAARVELEAGRDDEAREWLTALGETAASDPEVHDILGQGHGFLVETEKARAAFAEARKLDPLYVEATIHEVELLLRTEQLEPAIGLLDEQQASLVEAGAKASERGRQALAAIDRQRALIYRGQGELERALTATEDAIKTDPANNDALLLRAELLGELGQRKAHEEALAKLHERTGGYPGLTEPLGKVLLRKRKLDELEALIGASLDNPDATREILLTGAALRLAQDRVEQAKGYAQKVLDRNPTDNKAHLLLGRALLAEGQYERALEELQSAQTREGDAEAELWLGQALEYNSRANEARGHYKRAIELDSNNLEAAALLGRLYAYEGAARKAMELLEPVVAQTNDYPYAYLALGLAQRDLGKPELAVANFQKAHEYDPTLFEAYYQAGRIHNDKNRHSETVKALQAGLDKAVAGAQDRQLLDAWRRLGESYFALGRRAEAKRALDEYMKLAPANAAGRREVERLLRDL